MKTEYILYLAVLVTAFAFLALLYLLLQDVRKSMINNKINKCIKYKIYKKISAKKVEKMIKYIEKNKKNIPLSTYNSSLYALERAILKINY